MYKLGGRNRSNKPRNYGVLLDMSTMYHTYAAIPTGPHGSAVFNVM